MPLRTTLDDKAASTAPTGWAADQGELDFSERIVFSDEEEESPVPSKPKQMVSDEKVIGSSTNGDLPSHNSRQHISISQAPADFSGPKETAVPQMSHGIPGSDIKAVPRVAGQAVGQGPIANRKPEDAENIMGLNTRAVVGLMQITPGSTAHPVPLSHPHQNQPHNFPSMSGVREAWTAAPSSPAVPHNQQHQPGHFQMVFNQGRMAQGPGFGGPPTAPIHPSAHHFTSNPSHIIAPPVSAGGPVFAPGQDDKHLSDQRNLHQKEYKMCIERARMKKRTDEGEARGMGSSVEEERETQRSRPRQRFDAPSGSSKGSMGDVTGLSDECEPPRSLPAAPREETGPPGGPPMPPPVPIVAQPPQPATAGHSSYPVAPHGMPPPGPFNTIPAAAAAAAAAAAHYGPRAPWPGPHPPGATAASYPHPPQPHPSFQHHQYAPPQAQIPTQLLDPSIRPKTTQEYSVLIEKFHEFLLQESKKDKGGKPEADQRTVHPNDPSQKSVVEQKDPFAEEESHDSRETMSKNAATDSSLAPGLSQQPKHVKRESHQDLSNLVSGPTPGMKRPIAQTQLPRDENCQEPSQVSRRSDFRPSSSERDSQPGRAGASRTDVWEDRGKWHQRKPEDNEEIGEYGEEAGETEDEDKKRSGNRDTRVHGTAQKRNRNVGEQQYYNDNQRRKPKTTSLREYK